ncbi:hypothetical protein [Nitrosomonas aestuarii]|uniref:hypothetical protein n=1 Tax=Nitrosomonas aestuarii TaxID=52441 RepID=UPI000D4E5A96|nr:hypothetical protein [Nitrosomonas aestuarii]PTN12843.1 hypothetical protein C8R11_102118 [Nitrosomonas aestuarii]
MVRPDYDQFTCNLCGNSSSVSHDFHREGGACSHCGSNMRYRALMRALSQHLYDKPLPLSAFIPDKNFKAMGLSDASLYADKLATLYDYTNFFYHTDPFLDICNIENMISGSYDLLITSDVFEHVPPPRHIAFVNSWHLLKPGGLLLLTVPYTLLPKTVEHFPSLHHFGLVNDGTDILLVNRREDQTIEVFDKLIWHGGEGSTLEMRVYSETDLIQIISAAGFKEIKIWNEDFQENGILQSHQGGSFVITATKDENSAPITITHNDPYRENIYPEDMCIDHFLVHRPARVSGTRAERAIELWNTNTPQHKTAPPVFTRIWLYIRRKLTG